MKIDKKAYEVYYAMFFSGQKILDVGCSAGHFLAHCSRESWGVEIDEEKLRTAREGSLNVKKCDLDREKLPFSDSTFDAVNSTFVLEHLRNPFKCFSEMLRVLKKGGKFIIRVPNIKYHKFSFWNGFDHLTPFTKEKLEDYCRQLWLKNFKVYYFKKGVPGLRVLYNMGLSPSILKKIVLFVSYSQREDLLLEGYKAD